MHTIQQTELAGRAHNSRAHSFVSRDNVTWHSDLDGVASLSWSLDSSLCQPCRVSHTTVEKYGAGQDPTGAGGCVALPFRGSCGEECWARLGRAVVARNTSRLEHRLDFGVGCRSTNNYYSLMSVSMRRLLPDSVERGSLPSTGGNCSKQISMSGDIFIR